MHNHEMIQAAQRRDALERQQEILFDIAFNLGAEHKPLSQQNSDLMDWLEGSRGLFERVKIWAADFDAVWEGNKAAGREQEDYLLDIDRFTSTQWAKLEEEFQAAQNVVCGVQVVPYITRSEGNTVVPQLNGPTDQTEGWSIYTRDPCGLAHWFADLGDEDAAMFVGRALAFKHNVKIEPQPWKKEQSDEQAG